jgi:hypothetical protein
MSRKSHYSGGSTDVGPRDKSWFSKGSTQIPPNEAAPRPPLSVAEKAAFAAFKQSKESGVRLIPKGENNKKRKARPGKPAKKPSPVKTEPSVRTEPSLRKGSTTTYQMLKKNKFKTVTVEFTSDRKRKS